MKFFVDTAEIAEIRELQDTGLLDGVTTNPSLVKKSGRDFIEVVKEIASVCPGPVSAEVVALDHEGMMREAEVLRKIADNIAVKVPLTIDGLKTCKALTGDGTMVNVTLCFSAAQALLAAKAGATFISPFVGRHDDVGFDGMALIADIRSFADSTIQADTIFFGGGTPSLLEPSELRRIIDACRNAFTVSMDAEITLEANPESSTPEALEGFRAAGANRLSVGVQSFRDEELQRLGRLHSSQTARTAVRAARAAGFDGRLHAPLPHARGLALALAEEVELGAAHPGVLDHLDLFDGLRVQGEDPLHPDAARDLAHREHFARSAALPGDDDPLEGLQALLVPFFDLHLHPDGVPGAELRNVLAQIALLDVDE